MSASLLRLLRTASLLGLSALLASPAVSARPTGPAGDGEFDRALPPLDLVPAAAPTPVVTPVDSVPPALTEPLPSLAEFDAASPAAAPDQTAAAEKLSDIPYRVEISGLKPVGLDARFRELSALLHDGKKAANAAQIRARAAEDEQLGVRLLHSSGYFDGLTTATMPSSVAPGQPVTVAVAATPGELYTLRTITLTGLAAEPYGLARTALALQPGNPIDVARIEDAEAHISLRLPESGYPFVKVGQRDIALVDAAPLGDYTLPVTSGPRSRFGGLRTEGDAIFTREHLAIFPRFKPGELYDSRKVDDLRQALIGTSMFSTIAVEPVQTDTVASDRTTAVDLLVRQVKGPVRTLSASGGYGTGQGITLTGEWAHRNLFPPEGALILDATAGTLQQSVGATFRRSDAGQRDRAFQSGLTVSRQRFDAYSANTVDLSTSISRQSTPIWQKHWTYSIGAELTATRENPFDPADQENPKSTYFLAALPLQGGYDGSDSLLDPTRGFRVSTKITPTVQKQQDGGFDKYVGLLAETSGYYPIGSSIVVAGRARVGSIVGAGRDAIAPSRRLYSGGGGSVRGFGYQQLGPKDASNDPIGGRSLTEFAVETRYRFGTYGVVPFFDAGRVGTSATPSLSNMRYGVGIGVRYYTNFGPFRLDVATPLGRKPGESKVGVYISVGQAF